MADLAGFWRDYKLRWNRRALLARCVRKRRQLRVVADRTAAIGRDEILAFVCVRNEAERLPYFLAHYRALGVRHFLIVSNDSSDATDTLLAQQADVSLWTSAASYKASRFGMDWLGGLQRRYGHGHWCLTVDADELLIYPHHDSRDLVALTRHLDAQGCASFGAIMLDLYPQGRLSEQTGADPLAALGWFDASGYWVQRKPKLECLWLQGGVRARRFFEKEPDRAPTLNKIPLVKWHRGFVYVSSMHTMLPKRLNHTYDENGTVKTTGALLHTKFLKSIVARSGDEKHRAEHFANSLLYDEYYDDLATDPVLWSDVDSIRYRDWRQLEDLGLIACGNWT